MKRYLKMLATFFVLVLALSACTAGLPAKTAPAATEAPTASPVPATATPVSTPEPSAQPAETEKSNERIYALEDFYNLPAGRSSVKELIEQNLSVPSETNSFLHFIYFTSDPKVTVRLGLDSDFGAVSFVSYLHEDMPEMDRTVSYAGTFVDEHSLGIHEIAEEESENIPLDLTYSLQDFAWIKLGKTTFEEVCKYTAGEDYFYFKSNLKILRYPSAVPGGYFSISVGEDNIVYQVLNMWEAENDPEKETFFTEKYQEEKMKAMEEYLKEDWPW